MSVKILTVDDSKTIRMVVGKAFQNYDVAIFEAANGEEGLAAAAKEKPDLILLDYTMPVLDGFQTLTRLRADAALKSTPVIMLTAEAGRDTVVKIATLGVRDYLIKPFKEELLIERVGRVLALKPKAVAPAKPHRYDDPIGILVVDDKPAITNQIKTGLSDTPWKVLSAENESAALAVVGSQPVDAVLISLSLPNESAYTAYQALRANPKTANAPIFGLCVKTAVADQTRAQQAGFTGCVTKPIDCEDLKSKIARSLKLETAYRYFQERDGILTIRLPKNFHAGVAQDVSTNLDEQLTATVDAGNDKLIVDLTEVQAPSLPIIELVVSTTDACNKLSLKSAVIGSESVRAECRNFEESQKWLFVGTFEEALSSLSKN